jgi:hypothetical protein
MQCNHYAFARIVSQLLLVVSLSLGEVLVRPHTELSYCGDWHHGRKDSL